MARGTDLATLRKMLKAEIGFSQETTTQDQELNTLLSNKQKFLARQQDWPFLQRRWSFTIPAKTRYYNFPTTEDAPTSQVDSEINFERPVILEVKYSLRWQVVTYSVDSEEYNFLDSDRSVMVMNPSQKWRFATNVTDPTAADQFEIWPVPSEPQQLRFTAQRTLLPLVQDQDVADLDDLLLVYLVAGDKLTRMELPDAKQKYVLAEEILSRIRASYPTRNRAIVIGEGRMDKPMRRRVPITTIAG